MRKTKTFGGSFLSMVLAAAVAAPTAAHAADGDDYDAARPGVTFGGRAMYFRPKQADDGSLSGGAQLRFHLTSVFAVEASADYRQNRFEGTTVDVIPAQGSLMLYLAPGLGVSPYLLGGLGWYYTHVKGSGGKTNHRFGPHAGAGIEVALNRRWSVDGSYRYLWTQSLQAPTSAHPAGRNFSDNGFMLTTALNYRF